MPSSKSAMIATAVGALVMPTTRASDRVRGLAKRKHAFAVVGVADPLPLDRV